MDPTTIAILLAPQIISGLAQAFNSAQANGANQHVLDGIKAQYESLLPPNFNMSITAPPALQAQALASPAFQQAIASPSYDLTKLSPEKLSVVGQYAPQLQPLIKEAAAQTISNQTPDQLAGRNAQLEALKKFSQVGAGGFDPQYALKVQQAQQAAQTEAQGRQGALMDSFARRGISGSGLELAANMAGNAQTMNNLSSQAQQAAAQSYQNQLGALSQGANIGAGLQSQDMSLQAQNAAIINAFNQRMAQNAQNVAGSNTSAMNNANQFNLQNAQNVANGNVTNANNFATQQQTRQDEIAQQMYRAALQNTLSNNQNAQQTYLNNVSQQNNINDNNKWLANFQQNGVTNYNNNLSNIYNSQLNKLNGLSGVGNQQMAQNTNVAKSGNAAISSLGDLGSMAGYAYATTPKTAAPKTNYYDNTPGSTQTNVFDDNSDVWRTS